MEGFSYVDIFATKGIEYLLVIGFLLLFVVFWRSLARPAKAVFQATKRLVPVVNEWFSLPEEIYYHMGHSWAAPERKNLVRVGLDDFAQKLVGKINAIQVPGIGSTIHQGDKGWTLEVDSKTIDMLSPVDGKVTAINDKIVNSPENVNKYPYVSWLMEVESPRFSVNKKQLLSGTLVKKWMEEVKESLLSRMNDSLGLVYQDGGLLVDGMAKHLDRDNWDEIVKDFFLTHPAAPSPIVEGGER
ncbi:MAG TPA: glycine cleavage system protein H [Thermodesulfobacteriota bacterium]|nr:glycine cleavage system protein H [Thermodesulfobacteriota bacterium]